MFSGGRWNEREKWFLQEHLDLVHEISGQSKIIMKFARGEFGPPLVDELDLERFERITPYWMPYEPCFLPFRGKQADYNGIWIREFDDLSSATVVAWGHDADVRKIASSAEEYLFHEIEFAWECFWGGDRLPKLVAQIQEIYGPRAQSVLEAFEFMGDYSAPGKYEELKQKLPIFQDRTPMSVMQDNAQYSGALPEEESLSKLDSYIYREAISLSREFTEKYREYFNQIEFDHQMQKYFDAGEYSKAWYLLNSNINFGNNEAVVKWLHEFIDMTKTPILKRLYTWWLTGNDFKNRVPLSERIMLFIMDYIFWPISISKGIRD